MIKTTYIPKIVKARLKTNYTIEQLKKECSRYGFTENELNYIKKAYDYFNNVELYLSLWNHDKECYHLWDWEEQFDEKVITGIYYVILSAGYDYELDKFKKMLKSDTYELEVIICFKYSEVEVLKIVQEEKELELSAVTQEEKKI